MGMTLFLDLENLLPFIVMLTKGMFRRIPGALSVSMAHLVTTYTVLVMVINYFICFKNQIRKLEITGLILPTGRSQECRATGPGADKDIYGFESTRIIGQQQFEKV